MVRKKDVSTLYRTRQGLTKEESEKYFCHPQILNFAEDKYSDGVKLHVYLLLNNLGAEKSWNLVRSQIVGRDMSPKECKAIGLILRKAYKDAMKAMPSEGIVTQSDVASQIFKPLMEHCILVKRKYAEKFRLIFQHATSDRDEALSRMLFDISKPVIWRYLKAVNSSIRMGAYFVQVKVFPPSTDDDICATDYFNRHCEAFLKALRDPVVDICVQAIEGVCEMISMYFEQVPDQYTDKIFNELLVLSDDELVEIRATVFRGLRHFCGCAKAVLKFGALLKKICRNAIDDPSERVRCNVFRLLCIVSSSKIQVVVPPRTANIKPVVPIEDLLYRLDYEQNETVEREISRLLYINIFHKNISSEDRYKLLNSMCQLNRNACFDLHRMIYSLRDLKAESVLAHLSGTLSVCLRVLRTLVSTQIELKNKRLAKYDFDNYVLNGDEAIIDEKNETNTADDLNKLIQRVNDVIDCMVVCYSSMRCDPGFDDKVMQAKVICRSFTEITNVIIGHFESQEELVDTALSIVSMVRNAGVHASKIKHDCARMLRMGRLNTHYLGIYALIDMEELLKLLMTGLRQLENMVSDDASQALFNKKKLHANEFEKEGIVIEALMTLLNSPIHNQCIVETYMHYVSNFILQLDQTVDGFMMGLRRGQDVDMGLFLLCWKLWSILLIIRHNQDVFKEPENKSVARKGKNFGKLDEPQAKRRRSQEILSQIESDSYADPLIKEFNWMKENISGYPDFSAHEKIVESFFLSIEIHFKAYKHRKNVIRMVMAFAKRLHKLAKDRSAGQSIDQPFNACLKAGEHALMFAEADPPGLSIFEEEAESD